MKIQVQNFYVKGSVVFVLVVGPDFIEGSRSKLYVEESVVVLVVEPDFDFQADFSGICVSSSFVCAAGLFATCDVLTAP